MLWRLFSYAIARLLPGFSRKLALNVRLSSAALDDEEDQGKDEEDKDGGGADE